MKDEEKTIENLKRRIQFQDQTLYEQEAALDVLLRQGHRRSCGRPRTREEHRPLDRPAHRPVEGHAEGEERLRGDRAPGGAPSRRIITPHGQAVPRSTRASRSREMRGRFAPSRRQVEQGNRRAPQHIDQSGGLSSHEYRKKLGIEDSRKSLQARLIWKRIVCRSPRWLPRDKSRAITRNYP